MRQHAGAGEIKECRNFRRPARGPLVLCPAAFPPSRSWAGKMLSMTDTALAQALRARYPIIATLPDDARATVLAHEAQEIVVPACATWALTVLRLDLAQGLGAPGH